MILVIAPAISRSIRELAALFASLPRALADFRARGDAELVPPGSAGDSYVVREREDTRKIRNIYEC